MEKFHWIVYLSKKGKRKKLKKPNFKEGDRLPFSYRGNKNFQLSLKIEKDGEVETFKEKNMEIDKSKAKIKDSGKKLPEHIFENGLWWILKSSVKKMFSSKGILFPILFWSLFLTFLFFILSFFNVEGGNLILEAIIILVDENASLLTVLISSISFVSFLFVYALIPSDWPRIEAAALYVVNQFYSLSIGASAFFISSILIKYLSSNADLITKDLVGVFVITVLSHITYNYFIVYNEVISMTVRKFLFFSLVLISSLLFILSKFNY